MLKRLTYILMILLTATIQVAGQIDQVCRDSQRTYRVNGEEGSTWVWELTDSEGNVVSLSEASTDFNFTDSDGNTVYGNEQLIIWDVEPGVYSLSVEQTSIYGCINHELGEIEVYPSPEAFAGNTQTICPGESVELFEATAVNYSDLFWTMTGDGTFDDDTALNPVYTPGEQDIAAGTVTLTLTANGLSANGCYPAISSVDIVLINQDDLISVIDTTICENDIPFAWNGKDYYTSGTYVDTLTSTFGCDSIATLVLNVNPVSYSRTNLAICENELPFNWNGIDYFTDGTYRQTFTNSVGCDSIATLHLEIYPVYVEHEDIIICEAQLPYLWHGQTLNAAGTYADTLTSVVGCDSIIVLTLDAVPEFEIAEFEQICENQLPYSWHGQTLNVAGTYTDTLTSVAGCDSIVVLTLEVFPEFVTNETVEICESDLPYSWHGQVLESAGIYTETLTSVAGCDSIINLTLNLIPSGHSYTDIIICENELPFIWNEVEYTAPGTYDQIFDNEFGCDSIATLNLEVNPISVEYEDIIICDGQLPYTWHGQILTGSGTYSDTLASVAGCDSIIVMTLDVITEFISYETVEVCDAQLPYNWHGQTFFDAGTYTDTLTSVAGCDSIIVLALDVLPEFVTYETYETCETGLPYSWHGQTLNTSGIYSDTLISVAGCDSIIVLDLRVEPEARPVFAAIGPFCLDEEAPSLPTTSRNGISGRWNPSVISTDVAGSFEYTFTPNSGQCATSTSIFITVIEPVSPIFALEDSVCLDDEPIVLPEISEEGVHGTWDPSIVQTATLGTFDFTFTPDPNECALPVTISVTVRFDNEWPVAANDDYLTQFNTGISMQVLNNDFDPENQLDTTSLVIVSQPENGYAYVEGGQIVYMPTTSYIGFDELTYRIYDAGIPCGPLYDEATVTVEVLRPNNPPLAVDDYYYTGCSPIIGNVLLNDSEPDGDEIIINLTPLEEPLIGTLQLFENGDFIFDFIKGTTGTYQFVYEICDDFPFPLCDTATVYITIFADADCDNIADVDDIDDDNDGIIDVVEGDMNRDTDQDGIPDSLDLDSDNDGIADNIEAQPEGDYTYPSGIDSNENGLDDIYEFGGDLGLNPVDTDGDGTPDYVDEDSDGDNVPDYVEAYDPDAIGLPEVIPDGADDDADGLDNAYDYFFGGFKDSDLDNPYGTEPILQDFDGDGIRDWRDIDDDDDDILTIFEDLNGDGIYYNDDLDYDGHPEYLDYEGECVMFIPEGFSPDGDGIHDYFEIYCMGYYPDAKLLIFDREGYKLYEKDHYGNYEYWDVYENAWWNGETTSNHQNSLNKVVPGVYMYILDKGNGDLERGFVMVSY